MHDVLAALAATIEQRKSSPADSSYVASLHQKGLNKILEKVGEESVEAIIAAKDFQQTDSAEDRLEVIKETADLWFHTLVMLSHLNLTPDDVLEELAKRFGLSGLTEKENRNKS